MSKIELYAAETAVLQKAILTQLEADPRIVAVWLFGSHGRGGADALSDLDLWLIVTDEAYAELVAQKVAFVDELATAVLHLHAPQNAPQGGDYLAVQYDAPTAAHHVDFYWQPLSLAGRPPDTAVCFEKVPIPQVDAWPPFVGEDGGEKRPFHQFSYLWVMLMVLAKNVWRNPSSSQIQYLEFAIGTLHALQKDAEQPTAFDSNQEFLSASAKIEYLLQIAKTVNQLMAWYEQNGEAVPNRSVAGAMRFVQMIADALDETASPTQ